MSTNIFSKTPPLPVLRVKPLWPAWNNEIRGKYSRQSDTTKLLERCFKNCATAPCIPNLAVLWLSWSGRDFIGRPWCAEQTFPAGTLIWVRRYGCTLSAEPLNHVEAPKEELDLCCTFNCWHKPHNKPSCEAFKCLWTNRWVHFDNCRISVIMYMCTDKLMTLLNDLLILGWF